MVRIRCMNESDVDFVAQLAILANPYADASSYRKHIVEELREYPALSFVAENEEGVILGYAQGEVHGDIGVLEDLAVSESHQGRGIGTLLLKREIEAMKGMGARIIRAEVHYKCAGGDPLLLQVRISNSWVYSRSLWSRSRCHHTEARDPEEVIR